MSINWVKKGFASPPQRHISPAGGMIVYRAWGASSSEWGSGFFSVEKPESVLDAELRFNIADWGNGIRFLSTFRLKQGCAYYLGRVAHGRFDMHRTGTQVYVESPFVSKVEKLGSFEILRSDVYVSPKSGRA